MFRRYFSSALREKRKKKAVLDQTVLIDTLISMAVEDIFVWDTRCERKETKKLLYEFFGKGFRLVLTKHILQKKKIVHREAI